MNQNVLDKILSDKHKAVGLYLEEDTDNLYLMRKGDIAPVAVFGTHATIEAIRQEADTVLSWHLSGITFERS